MIALVVVGFVAVLVALGVYGHWLEQHPERTTTGRQVAERQTTELAAQRHAHELALMAARHEAELAALHADHACRARETAGAIEARLPQLVDDAYEAALATFNAGRTHQPSGQRLVHGHGTAPTIETDDVVVDRGGFEPADLGEWWAHSAGLVDADATHGAPVDETPTQSLGVLGWGYGADARWDGVRCADGRVKASLVLGQR